MRSCRERKKALNQERKTRRNRIMGPVYMTQSTGSRVPASCADFAKPSDFEDTQLDQHGRETLSDTIHFLCLGENQAEFPWGRTTGATSVRGNETYAQFNQNRMLLKHSLDQHDTASCPIFAISA